MTVTLARLWGGPGDGKLLAMPEAETRLEVRTMLSGKGLYIRAPWGPGDDPVWVWDGWDGTASRARRVGAGIALADGALYNMGATYAERLRQAVLDQAATAAEREGLRVLSALSTVVVSPGPVTGGHYLLARAVGVPR